MSIVVSKIMWGVSPDHCSPYKQFTGSRPPTVVIPPDVLPEDPDVDHFYYAVVWLSGSESGLNVDESLSHHGDAGGVVSTTNAAFGHNSMQGSNAAMMVGTAPVNDWNLSPHQMDEFTIEAWVYLDATLVGVTECICGRSFFSVAWYFGVDGTELRFTYQNQESGFGGHGGFINLLTTGANIIGGRWYYVAVCKDAAKHFRLYVNGVMLGRFTPNDATIDGTQTLDFLNIGQIGLFGTNRWVGNIDELRITKGVARYRTNTSYPVPRRAWPRPPPA